jgi:hypothetical protein
MTLSLAPMTVDWATQIAAWRYEAPLDVYNSSLDGVAAMLDGSHLAILDNGVLVGFVSLGVESRVRARAARRRHRRRHWHPARRVERAARHEGG